MDRRKADWYSLELIKPKKRIVDALFIQVCRYGTTDKALSKRRRVRTESRKHEQRVNDYCFILLKGEYTEPEWQSLQSACTK
jgi:hypothetical protein